MSFFSIARHGFFLSPFSSVHKLPERIPANLKLGACGSGVDQMKWVNLKVELFPILVLYINLDGQESEVSVTVFGSHNLPHIFGLDFRLATMRICLHCPHCCAGISRDIWMAALSLPSHVWKLPMAWALTPLHTASVLSYLCAGTGHNSPFPT